jgi:hypothetical protein
VCVAIATPLPQGNITQNDFFYTLNVSSELRESLASAELPSRLLARCEQADMAIDLLGS